MPELGEPGRSWGLDPAPAQAESELGFCLCHIKTSRGEGLSPPTHPAQEGAWACLKAHKMLMAEMSIGSKQGNRIET